MKWLRAWLIRVAGLWPGNRRERELADEIESHLAMHIADNLRAGMPADQARRAAILKSGGIEPAKEAYRDRRTVPVLENLLRDTRYAVRQLRQNPGFTATAVVVLALGLCASVAIFAFVDGALIKPLPYRDPARLVGVFETNAANLHANLSYLDYLDWKAQNRAFRSLEAYAHGGVGLTLATPSGSQRADGARVSAGFFRTLGVTPLLGRDFYAGEDLPAAPRAVLLSYAAWRARYGGNPGVLGQTVTLDGDPHAVIGVLPPDFHFAPAEPAEFWTALHPTSGCDLRRTCHDLFGLARLKDGVSLPAALADVRRIADQLAKQYPDIDLGRGAALMPLTEVIAGDIRPILLVLLGGAALLLLIASVNVAALLLVRSGNRTREMAVRTALGAGRARLVSQFVTEGLVLAGMGSALGVALAWCAIRFLLRLMPAEMLAGMPFLHGLGLNFRVLVFAGALSVAAAALFAITPAVHASLWDIRAGLAESSRGSAGSTWRRLGSKLVVVEIAMAMVLLISAGLLGKSLYRLLQVNVGFVRDHLLMLVVDARASAYTKSEQAIALERQVISRISNLPGVKSAGITSQIPLTDWGNTTWFHVSGKPWHGEHNDTPERAVNPAYFTALGARLLGGRYFNEAEDASKPLVAIVNQALAKRYFPGEDPIGQKLVYLSDNAPKLEIVGVVDDIKEGQLDTADRPAIYVPFNQEPANNFVLVVRTSQAEAPLLPTLAAAIHQIDSGIVVSGGATMRDRIDNSQSAYMHRSSAWLVGAFAAIALLLSVIGLYGVVAYSVSRRTREIGVRMALGAQPGAVYRLILREAGWLIAAGIAAGVICAMASATLWQRLLFDVRPSDPGTLAGVALVLGIAAFLASYIPARRAASVNPVEALRAE
ncbi:MAG TPA: ABC transporter permease [Bryobacteraceae bacterium]|jgi:predicted permease|nr:ABC transporter permease [Bryobacteraceae bacterium]